ncbi:MAG: ribonuclease HI [Candidatus Berkelbacteria bacterium Licking1014_85]|uniref:Ribonuclease HI n=1 Tax=Candidatus Berkelbacteria bacterium Licking1014_85 TaxID=2017148 RepID=A0A554LJN7_9BACT|nr:MAG: ribonuclease HI [Candidatus Berkelbacteria bacterium Licking1014_85]
MVNMTLIIFTDGGARGNPGPAGIGIVFYINGNIIAKLKKYIGEATNNIAEYTAVIFALDWVIENKPSADSIEFNLDSQLVVEQLNGNYKVKQDHLKKLHNEVQQKTQKIQQLYQPNISIKFFHIERSQNKIADKLVNLVLDEKK